MFVLKEIAQTLFKVSYVFAPCAGFLPQLYHGKIDYNPILSLLTIFCNILKLFPSQEKLSTVLIYQFCFSIILHFYLIRAQLKTVSINDNSSIESSPKNSDLIESNFVLSNFGFFSIDVIPRFRKMYKHLIYYVLSFIAIIGVLDRFDYSHLFMKASLLLEIVISLLHIKLIKTKSNLKILSLVLLIGDLAKATILTYQFNISEVPRELILSALAQFFINLYLYVRWKSKSLCSALALYYFSNQEYHFKFSK